MQFTLVLLLAVVSVASGLGCNYNNCQACTGNSGCYFDISDSSCKSSLLQLFAPAEKVIPLPLDCPAALPSFAYTDEFGRNRALVYSMSSNGENEAAAQLCLTNRVPGATVYKQYTTTCDWVGSTCSATVSLDPNANAIVVAFRGSKGSDQFLIEGANLILYLSSSSPFFNGKVFTYFSNAFQVLWGSGLAADLATLHQEHPEYEIQLFGHSLGGSLATIAGNALVRSGTFTSENVKVVTLGEPRTGDYDFASEVAVNIPNTYRIVHKTDLITKLPLKISLEQKNAYHNNFEVWYNNDMTTDEFAVNNRADDHSGSNAAAYTGGDDNHNNYFNVDMDTFGQNGCV